MVNAVSGSKVRAAKRADYERAAVNDGFDEGREAAKNAYNDQGKIRCFES